MRMLIVDDNAAVRRLIQNFVSQMADDIEECDDGLTAVAAYDRCRPDVVLMDLRMKYMDGLQATRLICSQDPSAKVLIVTDYDDAALREAAAAAGACGYQLKEHLIRLPELIRTISRTE